MSRVRSSLAILAFAIAAPLAAMSPLLAAKPVSVPETAIFPGWPAELDGRPLAALPLTDRETAFARDFPGRIGRFSDGHREVIVRYVSEPTRMLHPAAECLRAIGFSVKPAPTRRDAGGHAMSCITARRGNETLRVCESIRGAGGRSWGDVSAWYWSALFDGGGGPWWSLVIAERL